ncbi:MAG: GNAT family N-acetyltransferase [Chloroflexi bacterium]|nr:GNAT family N-acetyltransferase [Chloroflexota bacterium]
MIAIRDAVAADSQGLAEVQVDAQYADLGHLLPQEYLARFSYPEQASEWRELIERQTGEVILVADNNGRIAGYALGWADHGGTLGHDAELSSLHIRPSYQHTALAEKLLREMARRLSAKECGSLLAWFLEGNTAIEALYGRLGAEQVEEHEWDGNEEYDVHLHEVAVAWSDLHVLYD